METTSQETNMASINTQTEDGRGDSLERQTHDSLGRQTPLLDGDLSDDSIEYDDEGIIRMRLAMVSNKTDHATMG